MDVMVHSKVMIVDDRLLRIGSANLNNRSMGADSECDLVIEARSNAERAAISAARSRLLAMHCGVSEADAAEALRNQSLIAVSRMLGTSSQGWWILTMAGQKRRIIPGFLDAVADPERPIDAEAFIAMTSGEQGPGLRLRAASYAGPFRRADFISGRRLGGLLAGSRCSGERRSAIDRLPIGRHRSSSSACSWLARR